MQGRILDFNDDTKEGIISSSDGNRYVLVMNEWKSKTKPKSGDEVDFDVANGELRDVYLVSSSQKSSTYALLSLVFSLIGILSYGVASILGIIFGHIAKSKIKNEPSRYNGATMATIGLVIGYMVIVSWVLFWSAFVAFFKALIGLSL